MKFICVVFVFCLFAQPCLSQAQENSKFQAGIYSGLTLSNFYNSFYRSSPYPGWKVGLLIAYDLNPRWRLSGQIGATFDKCRVNLPTIAFSTKWKYWWADVTPLMSYLPIHRNNYQLAIGTGISIRTSLSTSVGNFANPASGEAIYQWTYFLPFQLSGGFNFENRSRFVLSIEYAVQLRPMYQGQPDSFTYTNQAGMMQSWALVASYSIPLRARA